MRSSRSKNPSELQQSLLGVSNSNKELELSSVKEYKSNNRYKWEINDDRVTFHKT